MQKRGCPWQLLFGYLFLVPSGASLFTVQESPTFRAGLMSNDLPLNWWDGGPAFTLASASAVRVNFRGVIAYPSGARLRYRLPDARSPPTNLIMAGWYSNPCNISGASLCVADVGRVFPSAQSAPRVPDRPGVMQVDGWRDLACAASNDKVLTSTGVYDITACDVLDEGLDVLFSHGFIFHRHNSIPYWKYWLLISLSIVLVRFLSYNVQTLWDATAAGGLKDQRVPLFCSTVITITVLLDGDATYVTAADQLFFWSTLAYICLYIGIHVWLGYFIMASAPDAHHHHDDKADEPPAAAGAGGPEPQSVNGHKKKAYEQPVYNVIVASLQLVAVRFYSSAETPYNIVILGMLACRAWSVAAFIHRIFLPLHRVNFLFFFFGTGRRFSSATRAAGSTARWSWTPSTYPCALSWVSMAPTSCSPAFSAFLTLPVFYSRETSRL